MKRRSLLKLLGIAAVALKLPRAEASGEKKIADVVPQHSALMSGGFPPGFASGMLATDVVFRTVGADGRLRTISCDLGQLDDA